MQKTNGTIEELITDAKDRYQQLMVIKEVLSTIPDDEIIIGAGDFNNYCFNEEDIPKYQIDEDMCQHYYSYFIIKDEFEKINVSLLTPNEGFSWNDKKLYKYKLDHFFTRNLICQNIRYDVDFRDNILIILNFLIKTEKK